MGFISRVLFNLIGCAIVRITLLSQIVVGAHCVLGILVMVRKAVATQHKNQ